jgi:RNA polymerase sigma-70 factor (ECF subfamily)
MPFIGLRAFGCANCPCTFNPSSSIPDFIVLQLFPALSVPSETKQTGTTNVEDKELVNSVLRGETHFFAAIIKNTEGLVAQIVFRTVDNPEDRKDIAQDIYLKVYKHLPTFKFQSKLSTWIAQIAYNTCFNYLEKKKLIVLEGPLSGNEAEEGLLEKTANQGLNSFTNETENALFRTERAAMVFSAMESLSPLYRTLITLYHYEELSYEEIAEITRLPIGTVKNYLFRARKALKDNLLYNYNKEEL